MDEPVESFYLDVAGEPDITRDVRKRNRMVGYVTAFLTVFTLGTTEIFASWYSTRMGGTPFESGLAFGVFGLVYMFSPVIGVRLSDNIGRKKTLLLSTGGYIVVIILFLLPFVFQRIRSRKSEINLTQLIIQRQGSFNRPLAVFPELG